MSPRIVPRRAMHRLGEARFSPARVWAMLLRYLYILRSSWPRTLELLYWPTLQMLIWGFMSQFLAQNSSYIAQPIIRLKRHAPEAWHVHALAVAPDHRGQGLGTRLLRIVDALAADEGVIETSLAVAESNEAAVRLYDREGYRVVASEPMVPHPGVNLSGNWLLMTRPVVPQG